MKTQKVAYTFVVTCLVLVGLSTISIPAQTPSQNLPPSFQGLAVEDFLKGGKVTRLRDIGQGVTLPQRATLELDGRQHDAVFKTIDEYSKVKQLDRGLEVEFQDSWKTEIAAYELDKLLGLGMVPATVERTFNGKKGSMQYWIDSKMSEAERVEKKLQPPSPFEWEEQVTKIRMFDNLIYNTDRHLNNLRITEDWKIRLIDHSRTFRPFDQLRDPKLLTRFSRALLEKIEQLNEPLLKEKLGNYLTPYQIQGLMKRRTAMLELSKKLVAEKGAGAVLYR